MVRIAPKFCRDENIFTRNPTLPDAITDFSLIAGIVTPVFRVNFLPLYPARVFGCTIVRVSVVLV
jgi:hypothetical protein